jgi:hypothetical protein
VDLWISGKGFSHGFGKTLANCQLVQWMADYNRHRPQEEKLIAEDLLTLLASEAPRLLVDSSRDELWEAELHGRSAAGLLVYHSAMADNSTQRVSRLLGIRDKLMADNLYSLTSIH